MWFDDTYNTRGFTSVFLIQWHLQYTSTFFTCWFLHSHFVVCLGWEMFYVFSWYMCMLFKFHTLNLSPAPMFSFVSLMSHCLCMCYCRLLAAHYSLCFQHIPLLINFSHMSRLVDNLFLDKQFWEALMTHQTCVGIFFVLDVRKYVGLHY